MPFFLAESAPKRIIHRQAILWLIGSGLICAIIFTITIPLPRVDGHLVGSDGLSYYAIARSLVFDQDFDFANDYALLGVHRSTTVLGLPRNPFAIGTSLLWMPFILLAHGLSLILFTLGLDVPLNGVSYIYEAAVCYATILYATLGFSMAYYTARRFCSASSALFATLAMWWATQAVYYMVAEPSMSHALTIFSVGAFLWVWYPPSQTRTAFDWAKIGLITGLVALVRWQDGIIGIVPVVEICWSTVQRQGHCQKLFEIWRCMGAAL